MPLTEILTVALGGAFGSLVKDIVNDGCIEMPDLKEQKLYLGFIGGAIIGAFVGVVIDGTFITALMAGFTGSSVITKLAVGSTVKGKADKKEQMGF